MLFPLAPLQWGLPGAGWPPSRWQTWQKHWGQPQHLQNWTQEKNQDESFLKEATSSWERGASRKGAELSLVMGVRKSRAGFKQFSTEENNECLILSPAKFPGVFILNLQPEQCRISGVFFIFCQVI